MCDVLQIEKSTFYYEAKDRQSEEQLTEAIVDIFQKNRRVYGTRKIKVKLLERGMILSRRGIGRIMKGFHVYHCPI
uniref:IS3 family transposase n=1 Tax=Paenibacillus sp. FSL R10-2796 TaxID=2954663 RepID=UPI00403F4FFC